VVEEEVNVVQVQRLKEAILEMEQEENLVTAEIVHGLRKMINILHVITKMEQVLFYMELGVVEEVRVQEEMEEQELLC
jgi:hypothetical protein